MSAVWKPLGGKAVGIVSSQDALKDVIPPAWEEDVLSGERKVTARQAVKK